jgi:pimeloyl-ACP methyl ester carboxylesterase
VQPLSRRIPGADDLTLHLLDWGGDGPARVFLHGFGMSARVWDPFAQALAPHFRVLALDARGHGDSDHDPRFRYSHAAVTRDLECAVEALGLERLGLVGHSMGGYASIRYAARHPERVERLVLVDAGPDLRLEAPRPKRRASRTPSKSGFESPSAYAAALGVVYPRAQADTLRALAPHWLRRRPDGRYEPKMDPAFLRPKSARDPEERRAFDRQAWAREESERLWRYLARVTCPVLVVRGEDSQVLSAGTAARMVDEVLRDGRAVEIPGAGHAVMLDAPEALVDALLAFLD